MECGLLGRKLGHTYSPQIHKFFGEYSYGIFEKEPEQLESFLKEDNFVGINVTMPYKKDVIPYLDEVSPLAAQLGAVNTIIRRKDGTLFGHNTDYYGFVTMVKHCGINMSGKKVLVLGSGGASNTAVSVLKDMGAHVVIVSRTGANNYGNLHVHADAAVIVNATPVGMYPNTGHAPVSLKDFPYLECVLDLIYNPARTQLLLDAEKLELPCENGLRMLVAQAKEAAEYFGGKQIDDSMIETVYRKMASQMQNIVLIGMPGCGKSTIAGLLAEKLGRTVIDTDQEIIKLAGKTIPEIFEEDGEACFRNLETQVLSEFGKQSQLIIATGGGCVTKERNYPLLHQNGRIFWLLRDISCLSTAGRPLSQNKELTDMFDARKRLYESFSDHCIDNNGTCENTLMQIISQLEGCI